MASRFTSRIVNASKWHSTHRNVSSSDSSHHLSALHHSSKPSARLGSELTLLRRYFGDKSKCCSSQRAPELSTRRSAENLHGKSLEVQKGFSIYKYDTQLPHQTRSLSTCSTFFSPSLLTRKMDGDGEKDSPSQSQSSRDYHQLAPLQGAVASDPKEDVKGIALSAIDAVTPNEMIIKAIQVEDGMLVVQGQRGLGICRRGINCREDLSGIKQCARII